jgi:predicted metalloendopeptidase
MPSELNTKYQDLNVTADNYHLNILNAHSWSQNQTWSKLFTKVDTSDNADWDMSPATVNAYYVICSHLQTAFAY